MIPSVVLAAGLILALSGLFWFFYPKPPPLNFIAFMGADRRLYGSLLCILFGSVLIVLGILLR